MDNEYILIKTTFDSKNTAEDVAKELVVKHIVATAQVAEVHSTYIYAGIFNSANVYELSCVTRRGRYKAVADCIEHVPSLSARQIMAVPLTFISSEFSAWIKEQTSAGDNK